MAEDWTTRFGSDTPRAAEWYERAKKVLPGGVSYAIRDFAPHPFYVTRGEGCRLHDVDGHTYLDYWCGHGALILGHAPDVVVRAVADQLTRGSHFGYSHPREVELAEQVSRRMPGAEMIRYTNSGTEAAMYTVGLARAFTGRLRLAKIEGGWHGGVEALNKAVRAPYDGAECCGQNPAAREATSVVRFNDLDAARDLLAGRDTAALFVEPLMGAAGFLPAEPAYLEGLRDLCTAAGTLLVFDEVISGFRLGPGGAQVRYGVTPDITILGKILGGGFPIGALCGRREILSRLDHRQVPRARDRAFHGGTFAANPVSVTAGLATLSSLDEAAYQRLEALGSRARDGIRAALDRAGLDAAVTGLASTVAIHFRRGVPRHAREAAAADMEMARAYYAFMLAHGVAFLTPTVPHMFISTAHGELEIDRFVSLTEEFAREACRRGTAP